MSTAEHSLSPVTGLLARVTGRRPRAAEVPPPAGAGATTVEPTPPVAKKRDVRVAALRRFAVSITVLNILGHTVLGFEQAPIDPILCLLVSYACSIGLEALDAWARDRRPDFAGGWSAMVTFLLPAHITALACGMLLYANATIWPYLFAVVVGVSSKYLFRLRVHGRLRHFLNPSNFGIAVVLLLFGWVGISPPYQFTNSVNGPIDWFLPVGILMLGTMLNAKLTKKTYLILGWVGGFVLQALIRWAFLDNALIGALLPMTGVAFILYTNYMITDPGTTPFKPRNQVFFGLGVAAVYGVLVSLQIVFGLFFALVIVCAIRGAGLYVQERLRNRTAAPAPAPAEPSAARAPVGDAQPAAVAP